MADVIDHGGNLTRAQQMFPHAPVPWLDLSTGINPHPYPFGALPASAFTRLPEESQLQKLLGAAADAYGVASASQIVAAPGTQILLPLVARLSRTGRAAILSPTYAEHRRAASIAGHQVTEVSSLDGMCDADHAVIVNPNNPDGRIVAQADLLELADGLQRQGGLLVVDEAFMEVSPAEASLAPHAAESGAIVLRSFGKFFGLAGIRLGFAIGPADRIAVLRAMLGPWAVPGPAIAIGLAALADRNWQERMRQQLAQEAATLDDLLRAAGLAVTGGTSLYRYVRTPGAQSLYHALGKAGILVRSFDFDDAALRFGLPGKPEGLSRLQRVLSEWREAQEAA